MHTLELTSHFEAFTLLVDSANEPTNKEVLRDPEYLGRLYTDAQSPLYADTNPVDDSAPPCMVQKV
jgi:hypothetical protein